MNGAAAPGAVFVLVVTLPSIKKTLMTRSTAALGAQFAADLLPRPQFEAEFSSQRRKGVHETWVEFIRAQTRLDRQLHEAPDFGNVERFKGVLGGHVFSSNALKLCSAISLPVGPVILHSG
jgi:hypothetical protein